MTAQDLFALAATLHQNRPEWASVDRTDPHFSVSVRTDESCWVALVSTNSFLTLVEAFTAVRTLLNGSRLQFQVERLDQSEEDSCRYETTMLEFGIFLPAE